MARAVCGLGLWLVGCYGHHSDFSAVAGSAAAEARVRLVFIGDTGASADGEGSHIEASELARLRASVRDEQADGIFALGDLIYGPGPLELSPRCATPRGKTEALLDARLGRYFADLGAPVWLVLGNHDVGHVRYAPRRARCLSAYAAEQPHLGLPSAQYTVDYGALARVVVVDTNVSPQRWDASAVGAALSPEGAGTWTLMAGHHVLRTAFDKEDEQQDPDHDYRGWLGAQHLQPDLWVNGHAHLLQFGVYDQIPAVTSGTGSKVRARPVCPGPDCQGADMPLFSRSLHGYLVVDLTPTQLDLQFKDSAGDRLWCWRRTPDDPTGEAYTCP